MANKKKDENQPIVVIKRGEMHEHSWTPLLPEILKRRDSQGVIVMQKKHTRKCELCGEVERYDHPDLVGK